MHVALNSAASAVVPEEHKVMSVNAVAHNYCQLVLHSSTNKQGMHFALKSAVVQWCLVTEERTLIDVNAVAQDCCQLVLHSSTKK